ncbi:uncharacterized protein LOC135809435 [Sycon ciliatum]|uniref:uncharacterized protein LOC135809435 n=1 Tax=Sycon ciliatum TaxID=27933 RepID=UPI0031F62640
MSELLDSSGNNDDGDVTAAGNVPERLLRKRKCDMPLLESPGKVPCEKPHTHGEPTDGSSTSSNGNHLHSVSAPLTPITRYIRCGGSQAPTRREIILYGCLHTFVGNQPFRARRHWNADVERALQAVNAIVPAEDRVDAYALYYYLHAGTMRGTMGKYLGKVRWRKFAPVWKDFQTRCKPELSRAGSSLDEGTDVQTCRAAANAAIIAWRSGGGSASSSEVPHPVAPTLPSTPVFPPTRAPTPTLPSTPAPTRALPTTPALPSTPVFPPTRAPTPTLHSTPARALPSTPVFPPARALPSTPVFPPTHAPALPSTPAPARALSSTPVFPPARALPSTPVFPPTCALPATPALSPTPALTGTHVLPSTHTALSTTVPQTTASNTTISSATFSIKSLFEYIMVRPTLEFSLWHVTDGQDSVMLQYHGGSPTHATRSIIVHNHLAYEVYIFGKKVVQEWQPCKINNIDDIKSVMAKVISARVCIGNSHAQNEELMKSRLDGETFHGKDGTVTAVLEESWVPGRCIRTSVCPIVVEIDIQCGACSVFSATLRKARSRQSNRTAEDRTTTAHAFLSRAELSGRLHDSQGQVRTMKRHISRLEERQERMVEVTCTIHQSS